MKRLLSLNEIHAGERYQVVPRSPDVQRGVGRGVFAKEGEMVTVGGYELDLIKSGALLPFEQAPAPPPAAPAAPEETATEPRPAKPKKGA